MKKTMILLIFSAAALCSKAQLVKTTSQDYGFGDALNKIVAGFSTNFLSIQGDKLPAEIDADTYRSTVCLPGALGCKIMRYHSLEDQSASWQAGIYGGGNYDEALKLYKKTFGLIKKTRVKTSDPAGNSFEGQLENVDENVRFSVSSLRLKTNDQLYKNLVAEVELISNYNGWEVHLNIYTKKAEATREDNMQ